MTNEGLRVLYSGHRYDLSLALARLGILPFFWIASFVVYEWARRDFSRPVAVFAVSAFTFLPPILAHAGLATTDMALTAFLGATFLSGMLWLREPTGARAVIFGTCGGLAILSKFSCLVFFPASVILALLGYVAIERPKPRSVLLGLSKRLPTLAVSAAVCCVVVWAGYRFSLGKVPFTSLTLPAPEFYAGIQQVQEHNHGGHISFLLGQRGRFGWWYFFPVALGVKTPLAFLILLILGCYLLVRQKLQFGRAWPPLAFSLGILFVGMTSTINIGVRHILPIYIGFSVIAAAAAFWMLQQKWHKPVVGIALGLLASWFAGSSLIAHPDYLPYFNELAGNHPENILVDSDLDWGQDVKRLAKRLREVGATEVTFLTPFLGDYEKQHGIPHRSDLLNVFRPPAGWCAISVSYWKEFRLGLGDRYAEYNIWPDVVSPQEKVGKGIFLWHFSPNQVQR
jgi:hypothetical protein